MFLSAAKRTGTAFVSNGMPARSVKSRVDLKCSMTRCRGSISSPDLEGWTVEDEGELDRESRVVFFPQFRHPFTARGHEWTSGKMRIKDPWAERSKTVEHLVD